MARGVFFDLDGTLIDTVFFHVIAWLRACRECGVEVDAARLHKLNGMGGDQLVNALVGEERPDLDAAHDRHMQEFEAETRAFPGAGALLTELHRRDAHIGVSTSGGRESALRALGLLLPDLSLFDTIVTREDTQATKPAPDLIAVALQRSDLDPDEAIYVGDTNWDVEAAARCGMRTIAVCTGGWTEQELMDAGAVAVYESVTYLVEHLDDSLLGGFLNGAI